MRSIFFISVLLFTQILIAGDGKGSGGDAVECKDEATLFDYFETPIFRTEHDKYELKELIDFVIKKIAIHSPTRSELYQIHFDTFVAESRFIKAGELGNIFDTGRRVRNIPVGCIFRQIAIQKNIVFGNIRYLINEPLWDKLDSLNKVGLMLHEILYRELKHETSKDLRIFNAFIMNTLFEQTPQSEYFKKLKETKFLWNTLNGIPIDLSLTKIVGTKVIPLTTYENVFFTILGNRVQSTRHFLSYYPNNQVKRLLVKGNFQFKTNFGNLKSYLDKNDIKFHTNGSLLSLNMSRSQIETDKHIIDICAQENQKDCRLVLYPNQAIHMIENAILVDKKTGNVLKNKTVKLTKVGQVYEIN